MAYMTDAQAWVCICAARLTELGVHDIDLDELARDLYRDEVLGQLDPVAAAECFLQPLKAAA
jgi:hypothetical protein